MMGHKVETQENPRGQRPRAASLAWRAEVTSPARVTVVEAGGLAEQGDTGGNEDQHVTGGKEDPSEARGVEG